MADVECPLCCGSFPNDKIEAHASRCTGELPLPPQTADDGAAGPSLPMVCPTCGGLHYVHECSFPAAAAATAIESIMDEGDTDGAEDVVIQVAGGAVQLPGSFVDDAVEGIDNLTAELGSECARRYQAPKGWGTTKMLRTSLTSSCPVMTTA